MIDRRTLLKWSAVPAFGQALSASELESLIRTPGPAVPPHQTTLLAEPAQLAGVNLTVTMIRLELEAGANSPPHIHLGFVAGYVVARTITFQVAGETSQVYQEGEAFWEPIGAVHQQFANSSSKTAVVVALHVGRSGEPVVVPRK
jgi:quercetin dioxygenase-like cupin family protein